SGPAGAVDGAGRFYARHLVAEAGRRLDRLATSLRDRSVNHVPRAVGTAMEGSLFVEEAVEGLGLPGAIAAGLADPQALASALRRFHESGVKEGEVRTPESRLAESLVVLDQLGRVEEFSPLCRELAERLDHALPDIGQGCLLHGDLHPNQVLISREGPFLIDLEDVAVGDPFDDIGHLAAHLIFMASWQEPGYRKQLMDFVGAFVRAYGSYGRPPRDMAFYTARSFIQRGSSAFRRQKGQWQARCSKNLEYAAAVLKGPPA
ncbi:MAG: aminoglycoside phosphotransferase family protein, partial [Actinomycetota bacterium]